VKRKYRATKERAMVLEMTFGKFKGKPIATVNDGYLLWCVDNFKGCPTYIHEELKRRGHTPSAPAPKTDAQSTQDDQEILERRSTPEELKKLIGSGKRIPNPNFDRCWKAYVEAGGDPSACPFDAMDGYKYSGPGFVKPVDP
jgi:hypothetical protein